MTTAGFASGVIFSNGDKVLLLRRAHSGMWSWPAGKTELGENAEETAIRECSEEIGRKPTNLKLVSRAPGSFVLFKCETEQFTPTLNAEHDGWIWASRTALPKPLFHGVLQSILTATADSARQVDENGYVTIENNPITRVGVFPYLGSNIDPALDPNEIVYVYRPAEELADRECIESFRMLPLIDDHAMLGPAEDGMLPPEKKGVHGIIGETVAFRDNVLYATLKIFSQTLADLIEKGKTALSLGYRCSYTKEAGTFAGQAYSYVQRSLRGNHIALVDAARCAVSVLDSRITMDSFDLNIKEPNMPTVEELSAQVTALDAAIKDLTAKNVQLQTALDESEKEKEAEDEKEDDDKKAEDESEEEKDKKAEDESEAEKKKDESMDEALKKIAALDADISNLKKAGIKALVSEVSKRDALAAKLARHVGTFDHADKTLDEVAAYGVEKLGLTCPKGHEQTALDSFLHNRPDPGSATAFASDADTKSSSVDTYLNKKS